MHYGVITACFSRVACLACLLLAAAMSADKAQAGQDDGVLVLGRITDDPQRHYEQLRPLLDYVVPRMREVGIREGRILMARDPQQMQSYLRRGRVDWVTETASMATLLEDRAGARPLLVTERDGVHLYRSVIFVRADSGIEGVDGLEGRSIAFQNLSSTSGYFVPAAELIRKGVPLEILLSPMDRPSLDALGYVFARTEMNIATWVHKRVVDAGAFSDLDWAQLGRVPGGLRDDLRVIHQSDPMPRAVEVVRQDLPPAVAERLREVLLAAAADPEARPALDAFFGTQRFVAIDAETARALDGMRSAVRRVKAELE